MEVSQGPGGVYFYLPRLTKALWAASLLKIFDHCGTLAKLLDGSQYIHPHTHIIKRFLRNNINIYHPFTSYIAKHFITSTLDFVLFRYQQQAALEQQSNQRLYQDPSPVPSQQSSRSYQPQQQQQQPQEPSSNLTSAVQPSRPESRCSISSVAGSASALPLAW
jgi:hypothetical protein